MTVPHPLRPFVYGILFFFLSIVVAALVGAAALSIWKEQDPVHYRRFIVDTLGIAVTNFSANFTLSEEGIRKAEEMGVDPDLLGRALSTYAWCVQQFDPMSCDPGIYIALTIGETANCTNAGTAYAMTEMRGRGFVNDIAALRMMLPAWQAKDIRSDPNSRSAEYIPPDYNIEGIKGSAGAGAIGCSQFMPGTFAIHWEDLGEENNDPWNLFNAMMAMASEVRRLGYRIDMSDARKIQVMLGWNNHPTWITSIVNTARSYLGSLGSQAGGDLATANALLDSVGFREGSASNLGNALGLLVTEGRWKPLVTWYLQVFDLMPETDFGSFASAAFYGDVDIPEGTMISPFNCTFYETGNDSTEHSYPAWDIASTCKDWTLVAPISGEVIYSGWSDVGYGYMVEIQNDKYHVRLAHADDLYVNVGDNVTAGQRVGLMGNTGNSEGPHLHIETSEMVEGVQVMRPPEQMLTNKPISEFAVAKQLPSFTTTGAGVTAVRLNMDDPSEIPQYDGEKENVYRWAQNNPVLTLAPGQIMSFCDETAGEWDTYIHAVGFDGGGICFNAGMIKEAVDADSRLEVPPGGWVRHGDKGFPRLHTSIVCGLTAGAYHPSDFKFKNVSDETIVIQWSQSDGYLYVSASSAP